MTTRTPPDHKTHTPSNRISPSATSGAGIDCQRALIGSANCFGGDITSPDAGMTGSDAAGMLIPVGRSRGRCVGRLDQAGLLNSAPPDQTMRRIGIDVGGTNTDAVLLEDGRVVHAIKTPTTEDVTDGIVAALDQLGRHPEVARGMIDGVVIGTTHFVNAVIQRRNLAPIAAIRIGMPAHAPLPPL